MKLLEFRRKHLRQAGASPKVPKEVVNAIRDYGRAREHLRIRIASTETHGRYLRQLDPPRIHITGTDLVQTFFVDIAPGSSHLAVTPALLDVWDVSVTDIIMAATIVETARGYTVQQFTGFQNEAAAAAAPVPKDGTVPVNVMGEPIMFSVVSSHSQDSGAYGVFLPEIQEELLGMFRHGYYLLLPNADYPLIIPYDPCISVADLQEFTADFYKKCNIEKRLSQHVYFVDGGSELSTLA